MMAILQTVKVCGSALDSPIWGIAIEGNVLPDQSRSTHQGTRQPHSSVILTAELCWIQIRDYCQVSHVRIER